MVISTDSSVLAGCHRKSSNAAEHPLTEHYVKDFKDVVCHGTFCSVWNKKREICKLSCLDAEAKLNLNWVKT